MMVANDLVAIVAVLADHRLEPGNGYHRTRQCSCGWKTRDEQAADVHRTHVAELILGALTVRRKAIHEAREA